jgi:hypothetical protein
MEDNRPLNVKVEDVRETVIKGVIDGADRVGKTAEAFGDGIKKGIDDAKPLKEKIENAGDAAVKVVAEGIDNLSKDIEAEKDKIENY